jgi:site-specific recombinase XerD
MEGFPVDPDAFSHWLTAIGRRAGIRVSPHRLRHTSATLMLNRGVAIEAVGKVLGHTDIKTTGVYARVLDSTGAEALQILASDLDEAARPGQ